MCEVTAQTTRLPVEQNVCCAPARAQGRIAEMSPLGPSRHFVGWAEFGRYWGMADIKPGRSS